MGKIFHLCLCLLISIVGNEAGKKRARAEMSEKAPLYDVDVTDGKVSNFCPNENPLKQSRKKRAFHDSDNDNFYAMNPSDGVKNKLVAAFLSDPECEGFNIFGANPSLQGNSGEAILDFHALIASNCLAVERHNMFSALSNDPSIGTPWRKYCASKAARRPVDQDRKKLLKAIKSNYMGGAPNFFIPDLCLKIAAKLRFRLENARNEGARSGVGTSGGTSSSTALTNAPAPFGGSRRCRDADPADCAAKAYLCYENDYEESMGQDCPIACRYCRVGETYSYDYERYYGAFGCVNRISGCQPTQCGGYYTEDFKQKNCALTCRRCSSFLRWRY